MSSRIIFIGISALFSVYCIFVALFTFFGMNVATYHLQKIYVLGFAAVYAILTPFGIAGIIGGLKRKKSLIRGFMFQYWVATLAFIGLSVGLIIMAPRNRRDTFDKCKNELPVTTDPDVVRETCRNKVFEIENIIKIVSFVQGGVLVAVGILVTISGIREFKDIKMDEETNNLIENATFDDKNEIQSDTSSMSMSDHNLLPPVRTLNRNVSNASTAYSNSSSNSSGSLNRYAPMDTLSLHSEVLRRNLTNASVTSFSQSSNYQYPNTTTNLSRNPTNASNYTSITTASSFSSTSNYSNRHYPPSSRNNPNVNRAHSNLTGGGISRYPTNASVYSSISSNSNYSNYSNNSIPRNNYTGVSQPPIHNQPPQPQPPYRPLQQYSSISDNNRFNINRTPSPYNINNVPPLTINNRPIIEEEEEIDYDDYNNYNYNKK